MQLNAMEIIIRIKELLTPKELENLGFSISTVSSWKQHNTIPKTESLYKIAKYLGVSMEYLLTGEKDANSFPDDVQKISTQLNTFSPEQRKLLISIIESQFQFWKNEFNSPKNNNRAE